MFLWLSSALQCITVSLRPLIRPFRLIVKIRSHYGEINMANKTLLPRNHIV